MRIDPNVVVFPVASATAGDTHKPRASESTGQGAAIVSLSAGAAAATQDRPEVSLDGRLERIKALIDRGEYPIDLDMLSSRIVDDDIMRGSGA